MTDEDKRSRSAGESRGPPHERRRLHRIPIRLPPEETRVAASREAPRPRIDARTVCAAGAAVVAAIAFQGVAQAESRRPLLPSPAAHYPPGTHYKPLCPAPDERGRRCFGEVLVDANEKPITDATSPPGGWTAPELEAAYGVPTTGGPNTVIATYIGSHYTNAESDVATYRAKFGLPPCTSANGCFMQIDSDTGSTTDFSGLTDDGCGGTLGEESLDVTMLQAGCPSCKILILEGNDNASAMAQAVSHGAVSMSMSWGYSPESESDCQQTWIPPAGLAFFGASGDSGYTATPGEPAGCTTVVAVGWTQLATDSSTRGYADTLPSGWGSAGGCDAAQTKGSWEKDPSCSSRMVSDISANGDNVAVYCTSPAGSANWEVTGGSSASSPFTTALLASFGITGGSFDPAWLYANEAKFWDVTSGGPVAGCPSGSPDYFCNAVTGYDGPTGVGTPYGPMLGTTTTGTDGGTSTTGTDGGQRLDDLRDAERELRAVPQRVRGIAGGSRVRTHLCDVQGDQREREPQSQLGAPLQWRDR